LPRLQLPAEPADLPKLHDFGETGDVFIRDHLLQGGERFGMESRRNRRALLFGR